MARCPKRVIRRHVLAALAKGITAADEGVAREALGRIDFILRGRAKKRLSGALVDAALATGVYGDDDPHATRHLLRAAALIVRGETVELGDRDAVRRAYEDRPIVAPPRLPVASIAAAVIVVSMATAFGAAVRHAPPPIELGFTRPAPRPAAGAYRDGGAPVRDRELDQVLAFDLPRVVADRGKAATLRDHSAFVRLGSGAEAWRGLMDALAHYDGADSRLDDAKSTLRAHVQHVSDELAAANLGYFLDVEFTNRGEPVLASYRVEKVTFVRAGDDKIRVLDLSRLAVADDARPVLGLKPEGMNDAMVVLDQIDEHVKTQLLPVLHGASYAIADDWWTGSARGRAASRSVASAIRRELGAALGRDAGSTETATARLRKLMLASVRHHEAQHGIEQESPPGYPAVLATLVGPVRDAAGRPNRAAVRARNELSAYTSQIASDMWLPQVALWNLSRSAFQLARRGSPESFVAVIVIEGLARQLGIPSPGPVIHGGAIDRDRLAALVGPLSERSTFELRSAAARLWQELFGEPLVRLVDDVFGE
ncbi:MAG TPA: hypothetical protein VFQ53_05805 [Kofleriaceae bacterium]|nr:hypothetical protein [Kofleriaceae bacterium]